MSAFFFSQIYTDEQNTQHSTETLSQPISQSVTATFSYNVLWYLYAGGLLWDRNSAQKGSVKSVSSVRERNVLRERITSPQVLHTCALWEKETLCSGERTFRGVICVIFNTHEKDLQRVTRPPFIYDRDISKMEEYNQHDFRELWTRNEERPFLHHEGPFLVSRRACSRTLKGVFHNLEWPPLYLRTMKIAYKHTLLNPPK